MPDDKTLRRTDAKASRCNDATLSRLHADSPVALALHKEGRKLAREKRRREWYEKHGGGK